MKDTLTFTLYTVDRHTQPIECDYVRLNIAEGSKGEFSGSYGVKKGHTRAVLALAEGEIRVSKQGNTVYCASTSGGFALIDDNSIRATVDSIIEESDI